MDIDLDAIRAREQAATPGPWEWYGSTGAQRLYLSSVHFGRQLVMSFKRWGMRSAQPEFAVGRSWKANPKGSGDFESAGVMTDAKDLIDRSNIVGLNHPDAVFIAAARADVAALLDLVDRQQAEIERLRALVGPDRSVEVANSEAACKVNDRSAVGGLCPAKLTEPGDSDSDWLCTLRVGPEGRHEGLHEARGPGGRVIYRTWSNDRPQPAEADTDRSTPIANAEAASPLSDRPDGAA